MISPTIYHNPRCSKSRAALSLIRGEGLEPKIIGYMNHYFARVELFEILKKLKMFPRDILGRSDPLYKKLTLQNKQLVNDDIVDLIMEFPKLLERSIVISDFSATIGRPPENIFNLFQAVKI